MNIQEEILRVSSKGLRKKHSYAMDIGGSVIKMVYTRERELDGDLDLHLVAFPRAERARAFEYLKEKTQAYLKPGEYIDTCGIGCNQYKTEIRETLGVEVRNQSEMECFVDAFRHLTSSMPITNLTHPPSEVARKYVNNHVAAFRTMQKDMEEKYTTRMENWQITEEAVDKSTDAVEMHSGLSSIDKAKNNEPNVEDTISGKDGSHVDNDSTEETKSQETDSKECNEAKYGSTDVEYPCLLLMCGSAGAPLKLNSDGTYQSMDILPMCGRSFLGLGCLLTGAKTFDDLLQCAARGNSQHLDVIGKDLKSESEEDFYSAVPDEILIYSMGHTVGKSFDEVNKDDLAASWLAIVCYNMAQIYSLWALVLDINNVYFCGTFPSNHQIRDEISKIFWFRSVANHLGKRVNHYFLKYGGYLGCIGALLMNLSRDENNEP